MRVLENFNDFVSNMVVEKMKLKVSKLELILSKKLRDILLKMNHQIADDLLSLHRDPSLEQKFDRTFLDLGNESDEISYIMANKIPELIEPDIVHGKFTKNKDIKIEPEYLSDDENPDEMEFEPLGDYEYTEIEKNPWISDYYHVPDLHEIQFTDKDHPVWHKNRISQKAIRVINTLFPRIYPANVKRTEREEKPNDVETFQQMYTALVDENSKKIVKVSGDEISYFYSRENYLDEANGTLGNSCMANPGKAKKYLKLYTDNPEKVSMLILFPEGRKDKIIGRAILWKIDRVNDVEVENYYFMDRIYTLKMGDEFMFTEYAKKHGYIYKSVQAYGTDYDLVTPDGNKKVNLSITLDPKSPNGYEYYPYLDTLQFYCKEDGEITNNKDTNKRYYRLTDIGGSWS